MHSNLQEYSTSVEDCIPICAFRVAHCDIGRLADLQKVRDTLFCEIQVWKEAVNVIRLVTTVQSNRLHELHNIGVWEHLELIEFDELVWHSTVVC